MMSCRVSISYREAVKQHHKEQGAQWFMSIGVSVSGPQSVHDSLIFPGARYSSYNRSAASSRACKITTLWCFPETVIETLSQREGCRLVHCTDDIIGGTGEINAAHCLLLLQEISMHSVWMDSMHRGSCTQVVVEERPTHDCKVLWVYNKTQ